MLRRLARRTSVSSALLVGFVGLVCWAGVVIASKSQEGVGNGAVFVSFLSFYLDLLFVASRVDYRLTPTIPYPPSFYTSKFSIDAFFQDTEIRQSGPVQRLSAIKEEVEASQSPIMRQVFAWLFPFDSPGWNAGISAPLWIPPAI